MKYKVIKPHTANYCKKLGSRPGAPGSIRPAVMPTCGEYGKLKLKKGDIVESRNLNNSSDYIQIKTNLEAASGGKGIITIPASKVRETDQSATPTNLKARQEGGAVAETISNTADKATSNPLITGAIIVGAIFLIQKSR